MKDSPCYLQALNEDLLTDITARLDGSTVAAMVCTCSDLRDVARDEKLWRKLCYSTWPSTKLTEAQNLLFSSPIGSFEKLYANSYPLISDQVRRNSKAVSGNLDRPELIKMPICPSNFASLVDVYYKNECITSRVLDGIPNAVDVYEVIVYCQSNDDRQRWFSNCPFKLDLLNLDPDEEPRNDDDLSQENREYEHQDHQKELLENLRLSWVLLDKKAGKTVNLSSWKPLLVQKSWPSEGDYFIQFGSIIAIEEIFAPHQLVYCKILIKCRRKEREGRLIWREISMCIEDMEGKKLNTRTSLMVLNRALFCRRSINGHQVEKAFCHYENRKKEMMRKRKLMNTFADSICLAVEVAIFLLICYVVINPF